MTSTPADPTAAVNAAHLSATAHTSWPATSQPARQARQLINRRALDWGLSGDRRDRAVLGTSEVVTNCVRHGSGVVRLRAYRLVPGGMRVEIDDDGPGVPIVRAPSAVAEHGRGMAIVQAVSSRWGWLRRPDGGKTVWFEIDPEVAGFME